MPAYPQPEVVQPHAGWSITMHMWYGGMIPVPHPMLPMVGPVDWRTQIFNRAIESVKTGGKRSKKTVA
jgi:hypothetical protein